MILRLTMVLLALAPSCASADTTAASACAAGLSDDGKMIYAASAPGIKSAGDKYQFVKSKTLALVAAGRIGPFSAQGDAEAAGECLKKMR